MQQNCKKGLCLAFLFSAMFLTGWEIAGMRSRQTKETAAVAYEAGNWGLGFGAEDADLALLEQAANALEHPQVQLALKEELAAGITFAKARECAVGRVFGERVSQILQQPNNILAVEYLAQLRGLSPERRPQAVPLELSLIHI